MDCFQDCCLFCDRDSPDGPYCSQHCRMADMEKASVSNPASPTSPSAFRTDSKRDSRYHLSPAFNFDQERTPGYEPPATANAQSTRPRSSYFLWSTPSYQHQRTPSDEPSLSPSSSRTSLSSTTSVASVPSRTALPQTKKELQDYYSLFDQARAAKRKSSTRS